MVNAKTIGRKVMYKAGDVVVNRLGEVVVLESVGSEGLGYQTKLGSGKYSSDTFIVIDKDSGVFNSFFPFGNKEQFDIVGYAKMTPKLTYSHLFDSYPDNEIGHAMEKLTEHIYGKEDMNKTSNRGADWNDFSKDVLHHIETYTIPQYGDAPDDMISNESPEYLMKQVQKYLNRFGKNQRAGQELLDLIKMTHCIQVAYSKLKEKNGD
jgi:hypothetical protein